MPKPELAFDHVVVTCDNLARGMDYIRHVFGVDIPVGGQHEFMGTHNAVMAVGDGIYFEVIAIDPSMKAPAYPRWFGLDNPKIKNQMSSPEIDGGPILMHYVLRTPDIAATLADLTPELRKKLGPVHEASRGDLSWQITINPTGLPPEGGCLPALIEWDGTPPQYGMAQHEGKAGPLFERIELCHPETERLTGELLAMGAGALINKGMISLHDSAAARLKAAFSHQDRAIYI